MDLEKKVRILAIKENTSVAGLAEKSHQRNVTLYKRLKQNDFKVSELIKMAEGVGCELEVNFILPTGEKI
jgi:predicted transcriptional regulator